MDIKEIVFDVCVRFVLSVMAFLGAVWMVPFMLAAIPLAFYEMGEIPEKLFYIGAKPLLTIAAFISGKEVGREST